MTRFGYTMMCEQSPPDQLVADLQLAERAGFDFSVISDHYQPWLAEQGHAGYTWSILGAAAQATEQIGLMTYVTCPTIRYHPAVVAQKAATMQILSGGRFRLGLGAARLWDRPSAPLAIGVAVSGRDSCTLAGELADIMIAVEPRSELGEMFDAAGGSGRPRVGQVAICHDPDRETAVQRAHEQFRWFGLGWKVNADLPNPESFEAATQFVKPDDVSEQIACGADVEEHVEKIRPFVEAGFDEIALVQIGADAQAAFIDWAQTQLLPSLRQL
jgi:alkanesulfonate monooxygenase SsuD/methylene tetrahydromethanopterin reductase-like flavin-dependent oxidoreductase (luciferase family)